MRKVIFVVFILLSNKAVSCNLAHQIDQLETEWAKIYYSSTWPNKAESYNKLLGKTLTLKSHNQHLSELLFWEAILTLSKAEHADPIDALMSINKAKGILLKAIEIDPGTMQGSAYVTLGTLYYQAPSWPISFGDKNKAETYLKKALAINSDSLDANYFYADFLIDQNEPQKALHYLERALTVPVRKNQTYADNQLKAIVLKTIKNLTNEQSIPPRKALANLTTSYN